MAKEILFTVEKLPNGSYTANAAGDSLSTSGASIEEVKLNAWDAVICKYEGADLPSISFSQN
jgi:hypothetical protein